MSRVLQLTSGSIAVPAINDGDVASGADVKSSKLRNMYRQFTRFALAIGATPVAREELVFVAALACTVKGFHALLNDTGTTTDCDFDLKKNGVSMLAAVVNITNADADRLVKDGSIAGSAVLAIGDVLSIELIVTTSTAAQGPYAWVNVEENGAAT